MDQTSNQLPGDPWDAVRAAGDVPPWGDGTASDRLVRLEDELELRAFQARYVVALDSGDIEAIMSCFDDDCVLINPRGNFMGSGAIRRDYEDVLTRSRLRMHFVTNTSVRVLHGRQEALMAAYSYALLVSNDDVLTAVAATTAERLRRRHGHWLISERRVTASIPLQPAPIATGFRLPSAHSR